MSQTLIKKKTAENQKEVANCITIRKKQVYEIILDTNFRTLVICDIMYSIPTVAIGF